MAETKVLIVENEALIALELEQRLSGLGYVVVGSSGTTDAAVRAAEDHHPDIVLMDIRLQGKRNGIDAATEIRDRFCIPVVFLTAYPDEETLARARESEPFGILIKPYREEDLRLAVEIALAKHQTEQALRRANDGLEQKVRERTEELSRTVKELKWEIAERKRMEAALRESEAKFRRLFDGATDGILIADISTRKFVEANKAMYDMLGYSREELLGLCIEDIHPAQDISRVLGEFQRTVENNEKIAGNLPIMRKDGSVFYADIGHTMVLLEGRPHAMGIFRDISERKRAEELLRSSNRRLEFLVSSSPAVIYTCRYGGDWAATFMSENLKDVMGYSAQENLGTPGFWADHIHPDDRERVFAGLSALETTDFYAHEYRFLHKDGTYRWMFDRLRVVRAEQGVPIECVGFWMDIADRKIAEERLHLLHKAVSTSRAGISFRDANNIIVFTNAAEARMHGYETSELIGRPAHILSPPELREDLSVEKMGGIAGWERESMNVRKDGTIFPVHLASDVVKDEHGAPLGIVTVCEDITERKRIENELKVYEQIVNCMAEGVVLTRTADRTIVYANPASERMFGYAPGELVGLEVSVLNTGGLEAPEEARIQHSLKTTGFWSGTLQNVKKDGSLFWSHATVVTFNHPLYGEVWLGVQQDISERKKAEMVIDGYRKKLEEMVTDRTRELQDTIERLHDEISERVKLTKELHRSKLFLTNILNSIQDGICVLDTKRKIMLVNSAVTRWVPEAELIGFRTHTCSDLYHKLGRCDECVAELAMKTGSVRAMIFPGGDGMNKKWFEVHSYPLNAEDGKIIGCVEYIRDVSAAKEMEERITQYQEQLRMLNYEMAALENREQRRIAQELHDSIPQTLAFCRMRLEAIEQRFASPSMSSDQAGGFQEIYALLDNGIAEARSLIFKLAPPVLYELGLKPAIKQLLHQFGKAHPIEFRFEGRGRSAPIQGESAAIMYGMVRELLTNAVKHAGASIVSVSVCRSDGDLIIEVRDNGRGFDHEKAAHRTQTEGGGFGLFSIRERVRHMEGVFIIESSEGHGACATIRIPLPRMQKTVPSQRKATEEA